MITKNHLIICVNSVVPEADRIAWLDYVNATFGTTITIDMFSNVPYYKTAVLWGVSCFWKSYVSDKFTDEAIATINAGFDQNLITCGVTDAPLQWLEEKGFTTEEPV